MSTHGGDIYFGVKLDEREYKQGLNTLDRKSDKVGANIGSKIGKGIGRAIGATLAGALATAGATIGISRLAMKASELGDEIDKMSQKMGMSAKVYQEWSYVMDIAGTSIESLQMGIKTLATSAMTSKDALKELGITEEDVASLSQEDLFSRVISGLQMVEDTTRRTYLAGQLLGRGATELAPLLNMTAEETERLKQRMHLLGGAMSDQAVQNSANFKDALTDLKLTFRGVSNALAETLLPVLTNALNNYIIPAITKAVAWIRAFIQALGALFSAIKNNPIARGAKAIKDAVNSAFGRKSQKQMTDAGNTMSGVGDATKDVGGNAKKAKKEVEALKRELLGFDRITKLTKQDENTGTSGDVGTGVSSGNVGAVSVGGIDYSDAMADTNSFVDRVQNALSRIQIPDSLRNALSDLGDAFSGLWDTISAGGQWAWENILVPLGRWTINELLPRQIEALAEAFKVFDNVLELLGAIFKPIWEPLLKPFFTFIGKISVAPLDMLVLGLKGLNIVLEFLTNAVESAWNGLKKLKEWLVEVATKSEISIYLKDKFSSAWKKVKEAWEKVKNKTATATLNIASTKFTSAWKKIKTTWESIKNKGVTATFNIASAKFQQGWKNFKQKWQDIKDKTVTATFNIASAKFQQGWNKIKTVWEGIKSKTVEITFGIVDKLRNGWNALADKVNNARERSEIARKWLPSMPYLAQGGYVKANTPQLAIIGDNKREGEIVSPESKLRAMAQEVANSSASSQMVTLLNAILVAIQTQDNAIYLDGKDITRSVVRNINDDTRRTGVSPILL